jgi:hypothetical protein
VETRSFPHIVFVLAFVGAATLEVVDAVALSFSLLVLTLKLVSIIVGVDTLPLPYPILKVPFEFLTVWMSKAPLSFAFIIAELTFVYRT